MNKNLSLLITGDFYITPHYTNKNVFAKDVIECFKSSDFNVVNLESPVVENNDELKIKKTGPCIRTNTEVKKQLNELNIDAVTLANNHILDYGVNGLESTFQFCNDNKLKTVGAGDNLIEAAKPLIFVKYGIKIGIVNFCESEWSIAEENIAGANPLDIIDNLKQSELLKNDVDYVIVVIHGGHEYYNLPSPNTQKMYRFFAEKGAHIIVGHHSHCVSGYETYKGVPIFYGLGNFIFTLNSKYDDWYTGLILELKINKDELTWDLIPVKQDRENFTTTLLKGNEKVAVLNKVKKYSRIIEDTSSLQDQWKRFVERKHREKISTFSPLNMFGNSRIKWLFNKLKISGIFERDTHYRSLLNNIRCESHLDLSKEAIKFKLKGKNENSNT